jgi:raffinose/stachyose/melibiose transport system permease protein
MKRRYLRWVWLFLTPAIIVYLVIYLYPLLSVLVTSFTDWNGFNMPNFIGLKNYIQLFQHANFQQSLKNSLIWAAYAVFVHVPFGVLVALVLAKKMRGWRFTRAAFMLPNVIAPSAIALLFTFVYKPDEGILNSLIRALGFADFRHNWLYSVDTAFTAITMIWLFYAAVITLITLAELLSVPEDLFEAARIDGANTWQIDWHINLPLLRKIIGTGMIIAVTAVFKKFDIVYMTTNGGPGNATMTLSVMMVNAITNTMSYGYANSIGLILIVLGVITMQVCNRIFKMGKSSYDEEG